MNFFFHAFTLLLLVVIEGRIAAKCLSYIKGNVGVSILSCQDINPENSFDRKKEEFQWIYDLPPSKRTEILNTYRGSLVKAKVEFSDAVQVGLSNKKGALAGQTIDIYLSPNGKNCANLNQQKIFGDLLEVCCDGGATPPCLLDKKYILKNFSILSLQEFNQKISNTQTKTTANIKNYEIGKKYFEQKKFSSAISFLEKARGEGELDFQGHILLATAYRKKDNCPKAIDALKVIEEKSRSGTWLAGDKEAERSGRFLLARCFARIGDSGRAMIILKGYLSEPKTYKQEIQDALKLKDFGWIHSSKEYQDFKVKAEKIKFK